MLNEVDVAIAGAGIGGAVLALSLARMGFRVALIEQARSFAPIYRGEFLQPRSLEILADLGLEEPIWRVTTPVYETRLRNSRGEVLCLVDYRKARGRYQEGRNGHHRAIQEAVLQALEAEPGASLHMGTRVTGLLRRADGAVEGLQTTAGPFRARLTVGADGQHSAVRNALGIKTVEYRYPGEPLAVTVELDTDPGVGVEFVFGAGESALLFPLPERRARLYLVLRDEVFQQKRQAPDQGLAYLKERLSALLPAYRAGIDRIPSMAGVQRVPCFYLRADRWVTDGVALLGDAVHCVSPTRGQGMNLAIQDSAALADLVGQLDRNRPLTARDLAPYQAVRERPAGFIQRDAGRVHRMMLVQNPAAIRLRDFWLGAIERAPETAAAILGMYTGTTRPPVWYDHLFVSLALAIPRLDPYIARIWGERLGPVERPRPRT